MDLQKRVEEEIADDLNYYRNKIREVKKSANTLRQLARLLAPEIEGEHLEISMTKFRLDCFTTERARRITSLLLENTKIKKFEKTMEESYNDLRWHYKGFFDGFPVLIGPAPADKKCNPIKKETKLPYWVCETKQSG